eukprot:761719-Hanusia_phi.AAC.3
MLASDVTSVMESESVPRSHAVRGKVLPQQKGKKGKSSSPPAVELRIGQKLNENKLTVTKKLGSGGFGTVYAAVDAAEKRTIAVKIQRPGKKLSQVKRHVGGERRGGGEGGGERAEREGEGEGVQRGVGASSGGEEEAS